MKTYTADEVGEMIGRALAREREQRKPLTDEQIIKQIIKLWSDAPNDTIDLRAFGGGVRFAEAAHGITGELK